MSGRAARRASPWRTVGLGCGGLIALTSISCLVGLALQPSDFRIARTRTIGASVDETRAFVSDVTRWETTLATSEHVAPAPTVTRSPAATGVGAWFQRDRGRGDVTRFTLAEIEPDHVTYDVTTGDAGRSRFTIELAAGSGGGTSVTYASTGELDTLPKRALWPVANLEGRLAPELEQSLDRLDAALRAR